MSRHLKAYAAPKSWTLLRKITKWVARPQQGVHPFERSLPVSLLLKQIGAAKTTKEAKKIVNSKAVKIDGKTIKNYHHSTGFMDSIQIQETALRGSIDNKGRLKFLEITADETGKKICKIIGKTTVKKGKTQLNLSDGRNILADKAYATGDSILIEVPSQKILEHYPLAKGSTVFLTAGRHIGVTGTVDNIEGRRIWCKTGKEKIETLVDFAYVIGKDKPALKI